MRAWEEFLIFQESELGVETVHKWLKTLKIVRFDARNLFLEAKDAFHAMWFEEHIRKKIHSKLVNNNNKKITVHLNIANANTAKSYKRKKDSSSKLDSAHSYNLIFDDLDPYNTFEHFVISQQNTATYELLRHLGGSSIGTKFTELGSFNPIYIHGLSGTGKTHLLMSATRALQNKGIKVLYSRAETFTEHVVSSIRSGEMSAFRQAYRNSDVLIIDGVQVLSKKGATQEEFFHTFNTLHMAGKQIILSANCSPSDLQHIEPRLISRFEWGTVMNLFPLSREELLKVLHQKAAFLKFPIHQKVIEFLLDNFKSGSKAITRALEALVLRSHLNEQSSNTSAQLTIPLVKQILNDLLIEENKHLLTPEKTIQFVAETFGIKANDLMSKGQTRECVFPRQLAMYICRNKLKMPFTKIGDLFLKDHSTVMSSVKNIQNGIEAKDNDVLSAYLSIQKKIESMN